MGVFKAIAPIKERDTHCRTTEITGKDTAAAGGGVKIKLDKRQVFGEEWRLRGGGRQERQSKQLNRTVTGIVLLSLALQNICKMLMSALRRSSRRSFKLHNQPITKSQRKTMSSPCSGPAAEAEVRQAALPEAPSVGFGGPVDRQEHSRSWRPFWDRGR